MIKSKRAEGVFGMSFGMIFSIILIVFFFVAAFIGIRTFLGWQKQVQVGIFLDNLQTDIDSAWNSNSATTNLNATLPGGIKYICFVNLSAPIKDANNIEKQIFGIMKEGYVDYSMNFYIYSPNNNYGFVWKSIKHLELPTENPKCIAVINGFVSLKIVRNFEDKFPHIVA